MWHQHLSKEDEEMESELVFIEMCRKRKRAVNPLILTRPENIVEVISKPKGSKPKPKEDDEYAVLMKDCPTHKDCTCPGIILCQCTCVYCKIMQQQEQLDRLQRTRKRKSLSGAVVVGGDPQQQQPKPKRKRKPLSDGDLQQQQPKPKQKRKGKPRTSYDPPPLQSPPPPPPTFMDQWLKSYSRQ